MRTAAESQRRRAVQPFFHQYLLIFVLPFVFYVNKDDISSVFLMLFLFSSWVFLF